jgi:hypothetical protein
MSSDLIELKIDVRLGGSCVRASREVGSGNGRGRVGGATKPPLPPLRCLIFPRKSRPSWGDEKSVLNSLKRLKRLSKAVETDRGWYSAATAPTISERAFAV